MHAVQHVDLVHRLNRQSVKKRFDAYEDVDWDHPDNQIALDDPRWERSPEDSLGGSGWYRALPQPVRARLGLHLTVHQMRVGMIFESVLCRGLLEFASTLPAETPELRYAYHEVIEESQHSLMFREFVARSGLESPGLTGFDAWSARRVPALGRTFPELFFLFVLGGEVPIDSEQRQVLAKKKNLHPLQRRIMQIHVTEEARHLAFARTYLRDRVPRLGMFRMTYLRIHTPILLAVMTKQMLEPPKHIVRAYEIPDAVLRAAVRENEDHRREMISHLEPLTTLAMELGIVTKRLVPLWKRLGIWPLG
jgi:hypothetical protein